MIRTLQETDIAGKRVLLRVCYDFSLKEVNGELTVPDDTRIRATMPTIQYLLDKRCSIIFLSWLKRPGGKVVEELRMGPVAKRLGELVGKDVKYVQSCVGPEAEEAARALQPGELLMLENVRFYPEEKEDNDAFAAQLANLADAVVFDAFGQAHRKHSSTTGLIRHAKAVCQGFLMEKEIAALSKVISNPARPLVAVMGGAKITDKVDVLKNFVSIADTILIGGALANTFLAAKDMPVGASLVDVESVNTGEEAMSSTDAAKELLKHENILLPLDLVAGSSVDAHDRRVIDLEKEAIPGDQSFLDIGPQTIQKFTTVLAGARTIFWNGPMGYFENETYADGTRAIANAVAANSGTTILGGGDTAVVVEKYGLNGAFTHVSTGGGASLEFVSGAPLPAIVELEKRSA